MGSRLAWRLEHGRLTIKCHPPQNPESFYVAINSEGLRWAWDGTFTGVGDWMLCVPLWAFLAVALGWAVWAWRGKHRSGSSVEEDRCAACGYVLKGLIGPVCPECGRQRPRA